MSSLVLSGPSAQPILLDGMRIPNGTPAPLSVAAAIVGPGLLAATANIATGSTVVTFSAPVSLPSGTAVYFSDQPTTPYALAVPVIGAVDGILSTPYTGPSDAAAVVTTKASSIIQFAAPLQLPEGQALVFGDQPSVTYFLAQAVPIPSPPFTPLSTATVSGSTPQASVPVTTAILTSPYTGPSDAGATVTIPIVPAIGQYLPYLPVGLIRVSALNLAAFHVSVVNNSPAIVFSAPVTLPAGTQLEFSVQAGVPYTLLNPINGAMAGTLTEPFTGPTAPLAVATNVTPIACSPIDADVEVVSKTGQKLIFGVQPFGDYAPTDFVTFIGQPDTYYCIGADRQPVVIQGIPASILSP